MWSLAAGRESHLQLLEEVVVHRQGLGAADVLLVGVLHPFISAVVSADSSGMSGTAHGAALHDARRHAPCTSLARIFLTDYHGRL